MLNVGYMVSMVSGIWPQIVKSLILLNTAGVIVPDYSSSSYVEVWQLISLDIDNAWISGIKNLKTEENLKRVAGHYKIILLQWRKDFVIL